MKFLTFFLIVSLLVLTSAFLQYPSFQNSKHVPNPSSSFIPFPDIVKPLGYPVEIHKITTEDGYILTFFRIQAKKQTSFKPGLPVVYLQHGLLDSADGWVINDEDNAPGLRLANEGYDVWLGNSRGNKYSMDHIRLLPENPDFWRFTFQNMSNYDLPAAFGYINRVTYQSIDYIGHSEGTIIMFAALSEKNPTVLKYLKKYIALSPMAWVANIKAGPVHTAAKTPITDIYKALHDYQFAPPNFLSSAVGKVFCKTYAKMCGNIMSYFFGTNPKYDNYERYNVLMKHEPSGTSLFNMVHWKQLVRDARFIKYDYGIDGNLQHYNQPYPPDFNVSNIKTPMHLFYAEDDSLIDGKDIDTLLNALSGNPNVVYKEYPADHITFLFGKDISFYFNDLLEILKSDNSVIG